MKEYLRIRRDIDRENTLKALIEEIEELFDAGNDELAEEKMKKANALVTADGRMLDEYAVRYYYSWTDLEGLVGELTINVPKIERIEAQDLEELIVWMRKVIADEETLEKLRSGEMKIHTAYTAIRKKDKQRKPEEEPQEEAQDDKPPVVAAYLEGSIPFEPVQRDATPEELEDELDSMLDSWRGDMEELLEKHHPVQRKHL